MTLIWSEFGLVGAEGKGGWLSIYWYLSEQSWLCVPPSTLKNFHDVFTRILSAQLFQGIFGTLDVSMLFIQHCSHLRERTHLPLNADFPRNLMMAKLCVYDDRWRVGFSNFWCMFPLDKGCCPDSLTSSVFMEPGVWQPCILLIMIQVTPSF